MSEITEKSREFFESAEADAILLRNYSDMPEQFVNYFLEADINKYVSGFLVVGKKEMRLLCSNLEYLDVKRILGKNKKVKVLSYDSEKQLVALLKKAKAKRIALNMQNYPKAAFDRLKKIMKGSRFADAGMKLNNLRETKTSKEIKKIRQACEISNKALEKVFSRKLAGLNEKQVSLKLRDKVEELGAEIASWSFAAVGKNAASPHHIPGNTGLSKGKLLLVDFGVKFEGYCSDISRTYCIGKPSEKQKGLYGKLSNALESSLKLVKPGVKASDLFANAQRILPFKLPHALGHGIGLQEHDFPAGIGRKSDWKLKEKMCLSLEPALYKKGEFGIRLEDNFVVTAQGFKRLSIAPKELLQI